MVDVPRADKSGAEVTAVQTLREFRRRSNFAKRLGLRQPCFARKQKIRRISSEMMCADVNMNCNNAQTIMTEEIQTGPKTRRI